MGNSIEKKLSMCGLCGEKCLIDLDISEGRIKSVQKAMEHEGLKGNICVKGAAMKQYIYHKDRLQHPMKRTGPKGSGQYEPISWDQAIKEIAERLIETKEEYGPYGTVVYVGHPHWPRRVISEFASVYGTPNFVTESSACHTAMTMAWSLVCGERLMPDMKNCDNFLLWAGNPAYSERDYKDLMELIEKRGIKMIVVDPRITPEADKAYKHLQIYPGTDGALALGLANVIISEGLEDKEYIDKYTVGFEEYKKYVSEFTPEKVAEITGISVNDIIETARIISTGRTALRTSGSAVVQCINGVQNQRAEFLLLALTGNIDREGGNLNTGAPKAELDDFHHNLSKRPDIEHDIADNRYPVWNIAVNNEGQCIGLADTIMNEDPYPIRNFLAFGINTGLWPRPDKIVEALKKVEFSVVTELFWNEAAQVADYVLPAEVPPEMDWAYVTGGGQVFYLPRSIDPGDKLNDVEITLRLAHAMNMEGDFLSLADWDAYLERILQSTGVSLEEIRNTPEGVHARKFKSGKRFSLETGMNTPSGKIEFVSGIVERFKDLPGHDPLPSYTDWRDVAGDRKKYPYILVAGGRKPFFFHSRTYRLEWISNLEPHTVVDMCQADADELGVKEGDNIKLSTPLGSMEYIVQIDNGAKKGVIHVCHDDPAGNINLLYPDTYRDPISGFPAFHSYICSLEKIGGKEIEA